MARHHTSIVWGKVVSKACGDAAAQMRAFSRTRRGVSFCMGMNLPSAWRGFVVEGARVGRASQEAGGAAPEHKRQLCVPGGPLFLPGQFAVHTKLYHIDYLNAI